MLSHNELKKGTKFIFNGQPYEVLDSSFVFKGRGSSFSQTKIRNLISGSVITKTFHAGDELEEADVEKVKAKFLYCHRNKYFFCNQKNPSFRFDLDREIIGENAVFLKPDENIEAIMFKGRIINISLPVKVQLKVVEAPPGVKGDRAQAGTKTVVLETGAELSVPLFIKAGNVVEINTEKGEYVRRV